MKTRLPIFALLVFAAAAVGWTAANRGRNADHVGEGPSDDRAAVTLTTSANATATDAPIEAKGETPSGDAVPSGDVVIPDSDALLRRAVSQLNATGGIEAKVRQRVDLFDRELIGSGSYVQQGSGVTTRLRLEMRMRTDKAATELLQVCNGETLWTFNAADGLRTLRRVDVDRVIDALRSDASTRPGGFSGVAMGLGGLPWMVDGLRQYCRFAPAESGRLGDLDVLIVNGTWRSEKLLALLPDDEKKRVAEGGKIDPARLPPHLPDGVVIYLGRDDLFPYRFDYTRTLPRDASQSAPAAGGVAVPAKSKTIVTLEFYEVQIGAAIPPDRFAYKPGQGAIDDTERYIERLKASQLSKP
ncbi:MAG: hypothetical protein WD875_18485 [Pirellulales bacterium]